MHKSLILPQETLLSKSKTIYEIKNNKKINEINNKKRAYHEEVTATQYSMGLIALFIVLGLAGLVVMIWGVIISKNCGATLLAIIIAVSILFLPPLALILAIYVIIRYRGGRGCGQNMSAGYISYAPRLW